MTVFTCKHLDPENCQTIMEVQSPPKKRRGNMVNLQRMSMEVSKSGMGSPGLKNDTFE